MGVFFFRRANRFLARIGEASIMARYLWKRDETGSVGAEFPSGVHKRGQENVSREEYE